MTTVTLIAAMAENRVIGSAGVMPWDVPEEYQQYLATVRDAAVVFGRKSYEEFGGDLDPSRVVVVTRSGPIDGVRSAPSIEQAIALAAEVARPRGCEVFVAGGASVYAAALPLAERMLLSTIHGDFDGDTFFPEFDPAAWRLEGVEEHARYTRRDWCRSTGVSG